MFGRKKKVESENIPRTKVVCPFQVENRKKNPSTHFECALTAHAIWSSSGVERFDCNPDWCPMFQTWKLLKEKQ